MLHGLQGPEGAVHDTVQDLVEPKVALRRRVRAERRLRTVETRAADARALAKVVTEVPAVTRARCVALYAAVPGEPDTGPLRAALAQSGIRVLLPIVLPDRRLDWAEDAGELAPALGVGGPEPTGARLGELGVRQADALLIPALAVDTLGRRLGQGAGYYDRVLTLVEPGVPVIALVHDNEVLDAAIEPVPAEAHDRSVHAVATPRRCLWLI